MNAPFYQSGLFGSDTGLLVALVLGIGFGFFLERGGLGSARTLTAQFYLIDMRVFKMMFTAILTAMSGLFWLSWMGILDLSEVHVLPTYLLPQTTGGLIFGAGFVMGGYCPGTSCVAAATGKADGLVFAAGMVGGILLFGELFPWIEPFYNSTAMGPVTLPQVFGIQTNTAGALIIVLAVLGFIAAGHIERRHPVAEATP